MGKSNKLGGGGPVVVVDGIIEGTTERAEVTGGDGAGDGGAVILIGTSVLGGIGGATVTGGKGGVGSPGEPGVGDAEASFGLIANVMLDENAVKITAIAQDKVESADVRMKEIVRLDPRFKGKDSAEWGSLLDVTPPAIRQTESWKAIQVEKKLPD